MRAGVSAFSELFLTCLDAVSFEILSPVHPGNLPDDGWDGLRLGGFCIECLEVIPGLVFVSVHSKLLAD